MLKTQQILQNRYCLQTQLSQNPTRQTWLAEDGKTQQKVIVKLLPFSAQTQWQDLKLFEREAQTLKHLDLAEIPSYLDYFPVDKETGGGLPWFALVQEYVAGSSLQQLLKRGEKFNEPAVKQIAEQLLKILIYLHELSPPVLHRDIKPSNIIRDKDGKIHLVDFGAVQDKAKAEGATFTVVGTGGYAPPEQLWGRAVAASDLYALGATLIHLLTGIAPGELPQQGMRLQFRDKVNLSPGFADWLEQLIAPAVERRYSSAREALAALQEIREEAAVRVRYGRLGGLALLQYGAIVLSILALPALGVYRYITEGKTNVGVMNRAQQAYVLENNEFADSLAKLAIGIPAETKNYRYETVETPLFAINYAIPKKNKFKGYAGIVVLNGSETPALPKIVTETLICENDTPISRYMKHRLANKPAGSGGVLRCPDWTTEITGNEEIMGTNIKTHGNRSKVSHFDLNFNFVYRALNEAFKSKPDLIAALNLISDLHNPKLGARTLITIAPYLETEEQRNLAREIVREIELEVNNVPPDKVRNFIGTSRQFWVQDALEAIKKGGRGREKAN